MKSRQNMFKRAFILLGLCIFIFTNICVYQIYKENSKIKSYVIASGIVTDKFTTSDICNSSNRICTNKYVIIDNNEYHVKDLYYDKIVTGQHTTLTVKGSPDITGIKAFITMIVVFIDIIAAIILIIISIVLISETINWCINYSDTKTTLKMHLKNKF